LTAVYEAEKMSGTLKSTY